MNKGFPALRVDLDRLRSGPIDWSGEFVDDPATWELEGVALLAPPQVSFRAEEGGSGGVRVQGVLSAQLGLSCRRCLRELPRSLEVEFDFRYDPAVQPWEEEEGLFALDAEAAVLDVAKALREELLLAVPEYPECADGCTGLCPSCGADLSAGDCGCDREERDPRWDVLRELVPDGEPSAAGPDANTDGRQE